MKFMLSAACVIAAALPAAPAWGQSKPADPVGLHAAELADGEVRKVDADNAKLTIKHGAIKNLDMPAMTMVFNVKDRNLLDTVKTGDKIRFKAVNEQGKFTVTELQVVR